MEGTTKYSLAQVAAHNSHNSCWVVVHGKVLDVTAFLPEHPGTATALSKDGRAGCDVTEAFERIGHSKAARALLDSFCIGYLAPIHPEELQRAPAIPEEQEPLPKPAAAAPSAQAWHAARRTQILAAHPEVAQLEGTCPATLAVAVLVCCVHGAAAIVVQALPLWCASLAAATVGAACRMFTFSIAHELCHGTVLECLRPRWRRLLALHLLTLPSIGSHLFEYYGHFHLGHHSALGSQGGSLDELVVALLEKHNSFDGDVVSPSTLLTLVRQPSIFEHPNACAEQSTLCNLRWLDPAWHLLLFIAYVAWSLLNGALAPWALGLSALLGCTRRHMLRKLRAATHLPTPVASRGSGASSRAVHIAPMEEEEEEKAAAATAAKLDTAATTNVATTAAATPTNASTIATSSSCTTATTTGNAAVAIDLKEAATSAPRCQPLTDPGSVNLGCGSLEQIDQVSRSEASDGF